MMLDKIDEKLISFLTELESEGFRFTLVGGMVRDFLINGQIGNDFDFEIRPNKSIPLEEWESYYSKLYKILENKKINFEKLPYLITKFDFEENSFEFSSPRLEKFISENSSHHNFDASLDPNLSHKESFSRRDFTLNAIGISFDFKNQNEELIDPYSGAIAIKNKTLININDNFYNDHVRFLRLIRFKNRFNFSIHSDILNNISKFDLSNISEHHFFQELRKSKAKSFINDLFDLNEKLIKKLPGKYNFIKNNEWPNSHINKNEFLNLLILNKKISTEDIINFFGQLKNEIEWKRKIIELKSIINLKREFHSLEEFSGTNELEFLKLLKSKDEFITQLSMLNNQEYQSLISLIQLLNQTKLTEDELKNTESTKRSTVLNLKIWKLWTQVIR